MEFKAIELKVGDKFTKKDREFIYEVINPFYTNSGWLVMDVRIDGDKYDQLIFNPKSCVVNLLTRATTI